MSQCTISATRLRPTANAHVQASTASRARLRPRLTIGKHTRNRMSAAEADAVVCLEGNVKFDAGTSRTGGDAR